jgi:hypothetical protein
VRGRLRCHASAHDPILLSSGAQCAGAWPGKEIGFRPLGSLIKKPTDPRASDEVPRSIRETKKKVATHRRRPHRKSQPQTNGVNCQNPMHLGKSHGWSRWCVRESRARAVFTIADEPARGPLAHPRAPPPRTRTRLHGTSPAGPVCGAAALHRGLLRRRLRHLRAAACRKNPWTDAPS